MHKIQLGLGSHQLNATLPDSWAEMGPYWPDVAGYVTAGLYADPAVLRVLLRQRRLFKMRPIKAKYWQQIPSEGLHALQGSLDFLAMPSGKPIYPSVRLGRKRYYLPDENMYNVSIVEFAFVDLAYEVLKLYQERDEKDNALEWTARFCAYMARPLDRQIDPKDAKQYKGDRRETFNTSLIDERIEAFKQIAPHYAFACLHYFLGVKKYLSRRYANTLFVDLSHEVDPDSIIGVDRQPQPRRYLDAIARLAGGKFGDLNATRQANLYDFLDEINNQMKS